MFKLKYGIRCAHKKNKQNKQLNEKPIVKLNQKHVRCRAGVPGGGFVRNRTGTHRRIWRRFYV